MYRKREVVAPKYMTGGVPFNPTTGEHAFMSLRKGIIIGKTDGSGISAISGTTVGIGTVTLQRRRRGSRELLDTGEERICYNMAGAVAASSYVAMIKDEYGDLWAIVENCA